VCSISSFWKNRLKLEMTVVKSRIIAQTSGQEIGETW
jgi:hypothetical protein